MKKKKKVKGCLHVHIKKGKIVNIFSHLSNLPQNCVIHLVPDEVLTEKEFIKSHPKDTGELKTEKSGKIFNLGNSAFTSPTTTHK